MGSLSLRAARAARWRRWLLADARPLASTAHSGLIVDAMAVGCTSRPLEVVYHGETSATYGAPSVSLRPAERSWASREPRRSSSNRPAGWLDPVHLGEHLAVADGARVVEVVGP